MFKPDFQRTDLLIDMIARIEVARDRILRAPVVPRWEAELRSDAVARSAHHSTSIEGNPLSLQEVTDLLAGRDILAHPRDRQEVLNYPSTCARSSCSTICIKARSASAITNIRACFKSQSEQPATIWLSW